MKIYKASLLPARLFETAAPPTEKTQKDGDSREPAGLCAGLSDRKENTKTEAVTAERRREPIIHSPSSTQLLTLGFFPFFLRVHQRIRFLYIFFKGFAAVRFRQNKTGTDPGRLRQTEFLRARRDGGRE